MIFRLVEQYFYSYIPDRIPFIDRQGIPVLLYAGKHGHSGQYEYFQFGFQLGPYDKGIFLLGMMQIFYTDEASYADIPVDGFQIACQRSVITSI